MRSQSFAGFVKGHCGFRNVKINIVVNRICSKNGIGQGRHTLPERQNINKEEREAYLEVTVSLTTHRHKSENNTRGKNEPSFLFSAAQDFPTGHSASHCLSISHDRVIWVSLQPSPFRSAVAIKGLLQFKITHVTCTLPGKSKITHVKRTLPGMLYVVRRMRGSDQERLHECAPDCATI